MAHEPNVYLAASKALLAGQALAEDTNADDRATQPTNPEPDDPIGIDTHKMPFVTKVPPEADAPEPDYEPDLFAEASTELAYARQVERAAAFDLGVRSALRGNVVQDNLDYRRNGGKPQATGKHANILNDDQIDQMCAFARFSTNLPEVILLMIGLMFFAGLRGGEVAKLRISTLLGPTGKILDYIVLHEATTKRRKRRIVPMHPMIRENLALVIEKHPMAERVAFTRRYGGKIKYMSALRVADFMYDLFEKLEFVGCSSHSGRRTFATRLLAQTGDIKLVQGFLGHARMDTTGRYLEPHADAVDAINKLYGDSDD